MGGVCNTHGTEKRNSYKFLSENLKGRDHVEDPRVHGRIILERCPILFEQITVRSIYMSCTHINQLGVFALLQIAYRRPRLSHTSESASLTSKTDVMPCKQGGRVHFTRILYRAFQKKMAEHMNHHAFYCTQESRSYLATVEDTKIPGFNNRR
jgi:hypothetical protein